MRLMLVLSWLVLLSTSRAEGSTLKGVILANELGGAPISRVQVSAVGANPTETGAAGTFSLLFPNAQPGDTVHVIVNKPGYVVVNYSQLRVALPKNPDAEPLTLLVCKESEREEWARKLFGLKNSETSEETYRKRVKELEERNEQTAKAMAQLREERD